MQTIGSVASVIAAIREDAAAEVERIDRAMADETGAILREEQSAVVTKAGNGHDDRFLSDQVWLYATILTAGYMISRGLAKSGSRQPYDDDSR